MRKQSSLGVSPAISAALLLGVIVAGFAIVSVSSFEFFMTLIDETPDAELRFEEIGDNEVNVTLLDNQNLDYVDIVMANGDVYTLNNEGESSRITIQQAGEITAIGRVTSTGNRQVVTTYNPENIRSIDGTVFQNPPAEDITIKIERAGSIISTQQTGADGTFGLVPSSPSGFYDIHVEQEENVEALIAPGTKDIEINLQQQVIDQGSGQYESLADLMMDGEGTADDPYQIENIGELQAVRSDKDAFYIITKDLDATVTQSPSWDPGFEYIGTQSERFNGTVETRNDEPIEITGLRMNDTDAAVFEYTTPDSDLNIQNVTVTDPQESEIEYARSAIKSFSFPDTVVEGRNINGSVTVRESGELTVGIPGISTQTKTVDIGTNSEKTVNFTLETSSKQIGSYTLDVQINDDKESVPIDILLPKAANEPVVANLDVPQDIGINNDNFTVMAEIVNAGDTTISGRDVTFNPGGIVAGQQTQTLDTLEPNQSQILTATFQLDPADTTGTYNMTVSGNELDARTTYEIIPAGRLFRIDNITAGTGYIEGDTVTIDTQVTNTRNEPGTDTITVSSSELGISDEITVQFDAGETKLVPLTLNTGLVGSGSYTFTALTSDDSKSTSVDLGSRDSGGITTSVIQPDSKFNYSVGDSITTTVAVRNDGDTETTPELSIRLEDTQGNLLTTEIVDTTPLSVGGSAEYTATFDTSNYEAGSYVIAPETQNNRSELNITLLRDQGVEIQNTKVLGNPDRIKRGGTLRANIDIQNTADVPIKDNLTVETASGASSGSTAYTLTPGESNRYRVTVPISDAEATGQTEIIVDTGYETQRVPITIR